MATQERIPYWQKLQDPRWQRKRLEIMQRDEFHCQMCGDSESTLNVHHGYYEKNREPWEYPPESLWTLCERCHNDIEESLQYIRKYIGRLIPESVVELEKLLCGVTNDVPWGPDVGRTLLVSNLVNKQRLGSHVLYQEIRFIRDAILAFRLDYDMLCDGGGI